MQKTTPIVKYSQYKDKCEELKLSIEDKDEKNIAIAGNFGSGKSSFIKTYEHAYNIKKGTITEKKKTN